MLGHPRFLAVVECRVLKIFVKPSGLLPALYREALSASLVI